MKTILEEGKLETVDLKSFGHNGSIPFSNMHFFAKHFAPYTLIKRVCSHKSILEIGFGQGYGLNYLSRYGCKYIGIDKSLQKYKEAGQHYNLSPLFVMDGVDLGFKANTFDIVYCCQVIEHIPQDKVLQFLKEIKRVLKIKGLFICSTLNLEIDIKGDLQQHKKRPDHYKEYTYRELASLLNKVFLDIQMYGLFRTSKHELFLRLKKWGLSKHPLFNKNPVQRFYENISTSDFRISSKNLRKCIDFIAICSKGA